jgi:hypothetical protein
MPFTFADTPIPEPIVDMHLRLVSAKSAFIGSGAAGFEPADASSGGNYFSRRFDHEDSGHGVVIDGDSSVPATIGASRDLAPILRRKRVRRVVDGVLSAEGRALSQSPTDDIVRQSADWWAREVDEAILAHLAAIFDGSAGCLRTTHKLSVATGSAPYVPISYAAVVKAAAMVGDAATDLACIVLHSKQWADLSLETAAKPQFLPLAGGQMVPFVHNLRVVVSDLVPVSGSGASAKYTAILLRPSGIYLAVQKGLQEFIATDPTVPQIVFSESMHFATAVGGTSWQTTDINPDNTALAVAASWAKTVSPATDSSNKGIGIVALETNASV